MGLSVRHDVVGDVLHVTFTGEFDLGTLPIISDALSKAMVGSCSTIVIDLNDVSSPDDSALGLLLATSTRAREAGRQLMVGDGFRAGVDVVALSEPSALSRPTRAAGPGCWWPRWARTATTGARR